MAEPDVHLVVGRYLRREIPETELRRWLTGFYEWLEDLAPEDELELGLIAMNFDFILQSGEWTEATFRRALEREHKKALRPRTSRVS